MNHLEKPRRRMRLPQLSKAHRRARAHQPRSEFVIMAHKIETEAAMRRAR